MHQGETISAATDRSISELVNDAVRAALVEDEEDLRAFSERAEESSVSYEDLLSRLKRDGKL